MSVLKFPRGSILVLTTGVYSDFHVTGFLVTVKDCDLPALAKEFEASNQAEINAGQREERLGVAPPREFASWLVARGHAMPIEHNEIHLADYDDEWSPEFGIKP